MQSGNETEIQITTENLEKYNKIADENIDSYFQSIFNFFENVFKWIADSLAESLKETFTPENVGREVAKFTVPIVLTYLNNFIPGVAAIPAHAAAHSVFGTFLNYFFSNPAPPTQAGASPAQAGASSAQAGARAQQAPSYRSSAAGRGVLGVDTQELIPQDLVPQELIPQELNPIRLALEALLCFMIWFGSKKCDSIKGFLITVLVAILLLFALMAITMGIVTGRNCGVGGKDLLQRIVYYAFVSIGYYFRDLFSGEAIDIFAKFATKTATFGALYFLFESVTAVAENKKPLKEEAKKLSENLKKDKK